MAIWVSGITIKTSLGNLIRIRVQLHFFYYMQGDGNLVIYDANNNAVWDSSTCFGEPPFRLVIENSGILMIYDVANSEKKGILLSAMLVTGAIPIVSDDP